jgi:hypothetical protein
MARFPLARILLPAVLISTGIFSALTLPFVLSRSRPIVIELSPLFSGEIEPIFTSERKDFAIRYLGFVIVLSVGAGLITAELIRKGYARRELAETQEKLSELQKKYEEQESELAVTRQLGITSNIFDAPDFAEEDHPQTPAALPNRGSAVTAIEATSSHADSIPSQIPNGNGRRGISNGSSISPVESISSLSPQPDVTSLQHHNLQNGNWTPSSEIYSYMVYPTCRISKGGSPQRQFALNLNEQYYKLFKAQISKNQAVAIAQRLVEKGKSIIVTEINQGYAVWMHEPEAVPEFV